MHQLSASPGAAAILRERLRQIVVEGWTPAHDATHADGELAAAASAYAEHAMMGLKIPGIVSNGGYSQMTPPTQWPWGMKAWKPTTPERDLEKAGALIAAQLDVMKGGVVIGIDMGQRPRQVRLHRRGLRFVPRAGSQRRSDGGLT